MVQKFNEHGVILNPGTGEKAYLLGLSSKLQSTDVWVVTEHYYDEEVWPEPELVQRTYSRSIPKPNDKTMHVNFNFEFPKVLVTANLEREAVTVSACEAYTDGSITDLAAVLRKHSPVVRAGYADGSFEDFALPWGADGHGYKVYKIDSGTETLLSPGGYDPKGGAYRVEQYFYYTEDGVEKQYPVIRSVNLTVTPVEARGVSGANLNRTYLNASGSTSPVPGSSSRLELPGEAVLSASPAPAAVSLTMSLDLSGWSNSPGNLSLTTATDGTAWPVDLSNHIVIGQGAGTYGFTYALTRSAIEADYPWLTVPGNFSLTATRVITVQPDAFVDAGAYDVTVGRVGTSGENAKFTVTKTDGVLNLQELKLFLPDGREVVSSLNIDTANGTITTTADDTTDTALRRYLNLGGWFVVTIQENGVAGVTEKLVYLAPRDNRYLSDGVFDFTGLHAGLFPYRRAAGLGSAVALPAGYYVGTTYDGATGAPGGTLSTVKATWSATDPVADPTNPQIDTYGPKEYDRARFDGYGLVGNPDLKTVTLRVEDGGKTLGSAADLALTCAPGTLGAALDGGGQVTGIVYDVRQVGYRARQAFTLILTNRGTADIHGLRLDLPENSEYEIIKAPAAYLAPGMSTTFVITYVYGLQLGDHVATIPITTAQSGADKTFTARFRVVPGAIRSVQVKTNSPIMGAAGIITGLPEGTPGTVTAPKTTGTVLPGTAAGPVGYEAEYKYVWMRSETFDLYEVGEVYYYDGAGDKVSLTEYAYTGAGGEGAQVRYWFFQMPDDDVTVHVDFAEPDRSKLRLSAILPEARKDADSMGPRTLRRWDAPAQPVGGDPLSLAESGLDHFLVMLDDDDVQAQLTVKLRKVAAFIPGYNEDIPVNVLIQNRKTGEMLLNKSGNTDEPTAYTGLAFTAPDPGESVDLVVTVSYQPGGAAEEVVWSVTVTFAKEPKTLGYTLGYGNSPYGMIMNSDLSDTDKVAAKAEFVKEYAFTNSLLTPDKAAGLKNIYYAEAWGGGDNLDLDDTALFIHPGEKFLDPGVTGVKDFSNRPVAASDIRRSVKVTLLDGGAATQAGRFSGGDTATLDLGTADTLTVADWWKNPVGGTDYLIRPGVYTLVYTFTDYDGVALQEIGRPLVILPRNGDVNADLAVGEQDARTIEHRVSDPLGYTAAPAVYPDRQLFRYRVCDVNNDKNFNNIDANLARRSGDIVPFYAPEDYK